MPSTTNPLTEIGAIVLAALFVVGGVALLFVGKIDVAFASSMFILAAGLLGFTGALKAPSLTQQAQIGTLAQSQQTLTSKVLDVLPQVVAAKPAGQASQPMEVAQPPPGPLGTFKAPLSDVGATQAQAQQFKAAGTFDMPIVPPGQPGPEMQFAPLERNWTGIPVPPRQPGQ